MVEHRRTGPATGGTVPRAESGALPSHEAAETDTGVRATLRLIETTDLHFHIMPYDYFADRPAPGSGLASAATLIRDLRDAAPNCLLMDNGDFLQGTPMSDWSADMDETEPAFINPMIAAMNTLGYDIATLGNHEFNYGLDFLQRILAQAAFPLVCANVLTARGTGPADDTPLMPPWMILTRTLMASDGSSHTVRVGVIGLAPPQIPAWERFTLDGAIVTRDIIEAARFQVPAMKAAGADIVVALSHSGLGPDNHTDGMENASTALAAVAGIDAVLMGHVHGVFPGPKVAATDAVDPVAGTLHGKPAVMAGFHGSHVGVIDLALVRDGTGWRVDGHSAAAVPVTPDPGAPRPADAAIADGVRQEHDRVLGIIRQPVARTIVPLSTHFAFAAASPALAVVADHLRAHACRVLTPDQRGDLPILAAVAPYKAGGQAGPEHFADIPAGPIAVRHVAELYPYPNGACILRLCGHDIADWLEVSAAAFARVTPGVHDQPLRAAHIPSYNFDVIHGLRYTIDPAQPVGARVSNLRLADGDALAADRTVLLITNGYRAGGGGGFAVALKGHILRSDRRPLRDILLSGLRETGDIAPRPRTVWKFARIPDTAAWFDTGTAAADHLPPGAAGDALTPLGPTPEGFLRYRIGFDDI